MSSILCSPTPLCVYELFVFPQVARKIITSTSNNGAIWLSEQFIRNYSYNSKKFSVALFWHYFYNWQVCLNYVCFVRANKTLNCTKLCQSSFLFGNFYMETLNVENNKYINVHKYTY